jgi:hypothetical protein
MQPGLAASNCAHLQAMFCSRDLGVPSATAMPTGLNAHIASPEPYVTSAVAAKKIALTSSSSKELQHSSQVC